MRICIFGNTGFLGSEVVKKLNNNFEIILPSRKIEEDYSYGNKIFTSFNPDKNIKIFTPDIVLNLIGILKETSGITYEKVHVFNTKEIVSASLNYGVKKIIHISAYGVFKGCKSRYFKTKEESENIIKSSGLDYLIIRPSVILGEGQMLLKELKKISSFVPFVLSPSGKVAPVEVSVVVNDIIEGINGKSGISELKGEVITYREMFEIMLESLGIKRKVISVPNVFFYPLILTQIFMKNPVMTVDLYRMLTCSKIYD